MRRVVAEGGLGQRWMVLTTVTAMMHETRENATCSIIAAITIISPLQLWQATPFIDLLLVTVDGASLSIRVWTPKASWIRGLSANDVVVLTNIRVKASNRNASQLFFSVNGGEGKSDVAVLWRDSPHLGPHPHPGAWDVTAPLVWSSDDIPGTKTSQSVLSTAAWLGRRQPPLGIDEAVVRYLIHYVQQSAALERGGGRAKAPASSHAIDVRQVRHLSPPRIMIADVSSLQELVLLAPLHPLITTTLSLTLTDICLAKRPHVRLSTAPPQTLQLSDFVFQGCSIHGLQLTVENGYALCSASTIHHPSSTIHHPCSPSWYYHPVTIIASCPISKLQMEMEVRRDIVGKIWIVDVITFIHCEIVREAVLSSVTHGVLGARRWQATVTMERSLPTPRFVLRDLDFENEP